MATKKPHTPTNVFKPTNKHATAVYTVLKTRGKTIKQLAKNAATQGTAKLLTKWLQANKLEQQGANAVFVSTAVFNGTLDNLPKTLGKCGGWQGAQSTFTNANKITFLLTGKLAQNSNPHPQANASTALGYLPIFVGSNLNYVAFMPLTLDQKNAILDNLKLSKATLFNSIMQNVQNSL